MFNKLPCVVLLIIVFNFSAVKCLEKPQNSIKNMTEIDNAKPKSKADMDPFKKDIRKYLRECGANISGEDDEEDANRGQEADESVEEILPQGKRTNNGQKSANWAYENKRKNKGTYPSHYGKKKGGNRSEEESDEEEDESDDDYRGSSNRRKGNNRKGNNRKGNKKRPSNDYDDSREHDNCDDDRRGGMNSGRRGSSSHNNHNKNNQWSSPSYWGNTHGSYGYSSDPYSIYNGGATDLWGTRGYTIYGGRLTALSSDSLRRKKRQYDEHQCMSQCVFGYLEMLDDNRVPAETEVIKYLYNKITNSNERTRLIKLARRCFAKLSTTDNEDGCQFSKELATCLQIEIKGESK